MKIFFAAMEIGNLPEIFLERTGRKLNVLYSYYYIKNNAIEIIEKNKPYVDNIMLDSGAFTLFDEDKKNEIPMHKNEYFNFLLEHKDYLKENIYNTLALDIDPNKDGFKNNYNLYKKARSIYSEVVPVVHSFSENTLSSDEDEIDDYYRWKPKTIAIGQIRENGKSIRTNKDNMPKLIDTVHKIKKLNCNCHLLGITSYEILKQLSMADTCDSRSWLEYAKIGKVNFNIKENNIFKHYEVHFSKYDKNKNSSTINNSFVIDFENWESDTNRRNDLNIFMKDIEFIGLKVDDFYSKNYVKAIALMNFFYYSKMIDEINQVKH